ncbi:beta-hexosaminidase 2 [Amborella trichopoda]|uniref:Beta-hexosaminidase n=1 Tax=Amborella trichopoda TaxID=13333 RepID=U5D4A7_AMBTC|nr:beta-hexosaminidase 2 [Amborella trichopoda]ERN20446.1 hypothetical protein AMTR_s00068p00123470 [Amborella trichopoda]|eukprot:XP_006858979.1 beta-hexosaminidase 2 [Amborella trichopoda]
MNLHYIPNALCSLSSLILLLFISSIPTSIAQPPQVLVWPKPRNLTWTPPYSSILLSPTFTISYSGSNPYLQNAVSRYLRLILAEKYTPVRPIPSNLTASTQPLQTLTLSVNDETPPLQHGVDESYSLSIPNGTAVLWSATVWGAMRGLETVSQLVWGDPARLPVGLEIWDSPLFEHRGVMLDTSRNYYGMREILRTIGAMSENKMNLFHWHITDSHSFPIVLPSVPELAEKGSYGAGMQYSAEEVRGIVEFGMSRGVRVVPEIDSPGHTGSWAAAYPEIVACANMFWSPPGKDPLAAEPGTGHLNPLHPNTYPLLRNVLRDLAALFPDSFLHAGADEVIPGCWKADPKIQAFLASGGTLSQLLETHVNATQPYIESLNRTAIYWEDVLLDSTINVKPELLSKETTILQSWNNGPNNTKLITSMGYRAIVSSSAFYYLDCGHGDFLGNDSSYDKMGDEGNGGSWCGPFKTWQRIYDYDITYGLTAEEAKLVLGGEVALWSEQADGTVLDPRLWPRTAAFAEAMWSGNRDETGIKRYAEATDRLNEWRYRMVARGVGAEPIQPLWCLKNPGMCNLSQ